MIKVYFEIFGTRLVKELDEKQYETMTNDQIEYFIRGKLKINKVVKKEATENPLNIFKDIFPDLDRS